MSNHVQDSQSHVFYVIEKPLNAKSLLQSNVQLRNSLPRFSFTVVLSTNYEPDC